MTVAQRPGDEPRVSAADAQIVAWAGLALVNALTIARTVPVAPGAWRARVLHHAYDAGQLLAAGLVSAIAVAAWRRWSPQRRWSGDAALAVVAVFLAAYALPFDLGGLAAKIARAARVGQETLWLSVLCAAAGLVIPACARLGDGCGRRGLRMAGVGLGLALAITNERVLRGDYPSVHLFLAWTAAVIAAGALTGAPMPERLRRAVPALVRGVALGLAGYAALVPAPASVRRAIFTTPGAVVAPLLAELRASRSTSILLEGSQPRADVPSSSPPLQRPDAVVLFVVIDALRADVLASEENLAKLPNIRALLRESVTFTKARSPASGTVWALASMFSSRYYSQLVWRPFPGAPTTLAYPFEDPTPRFPELLRGAGVSSLSVTQMPDVENAFGNCGVLRGFQVERAIAGRPTKGDTVTRAAVEVMQQARPPFLLYVHFLDTHAPYEAGAPSDPPMSRYLAKVAEVDGFLGELRASLVRRRLDGRATILLAADHGEAFGEHRTEHHAVSVYEELLRVPLAIRVPGVAARRVDAPVSLMDLAPTLLDLYGQATPGAYMGPSLVPYLRGEDPVLTRPIAAETGRWMRAIVFPDEFKLIEDSKRGTLEGYDLAVDPGELHNVIDDDSRAGVRVRELRAFFERNAYRAPGYVLPYRP